MNFLRVFVSPWLVVVKTALAIRTSSRNASIRFFGTSLTSYRFCLRARMPLNSNHAAPVARSVNEAGSGTGIGAVGCA